ncbi:TerB family tellurite resistance protein [Taklimakanibacter deserti]|uniref:tellurite resistance TerB family protein n=1 Tax=Taklimakanibacter deserti TaxID=2267839 RepID=UPI000E65CED6
MIDRLLDFLSGREAPAVARGTDDIEHAVAALLIEAARMDENFGAAERATIERLLANKFNLAPQAVNSLVEAAERAVEQSTQYYSFTRQINDRLSGDERVDIIEMMWKVAYSDGVIDPHEDMLLRRIAGLIHVSDRDRGLARKRALGDIATDIKPSGETN